MAYPYPSQRGRRPTEEERARWSSRPAHIMRRMRNIPLERRRWQLSESGMDRRSLFDWMAKLKGWEHPEKWRRPEDNRIFINRILEKIREHREDAYRWGFRLPGDEPPSAPIEFREAAE